MQTIATARVQGNALWPAARDEFHLRPTNRQFDVEISKTLKGQYVVRTKGVNPLAHTVPPWAGGIATEEQARALANDLFLYLRDRYTGGLGGPRWEHLDDRAICPRCEAFDSIDLKMLAWGNESTCTADGCDYRSYVSIGD